MDLQNLLMISSPKLIFLYLFTSSTESAVEAVLGPWYDIIGRRGRVSNKLTSETVGWIGSSNSGLKYKSGPGSCRKNIIYTFIPNLGELN
jgi:hypothetical protein